MRRKRGSERTDETECAKCQGEKVGAYGKQVIHSSRPPNKNTLRCVTPALGRRALGRTRSHRSHNWDSNLIGWREVLPQGLAPEPPTNLLARGLNAQALIPHLWSSKYRLVASKAVGVPALGWRKRGWPANAFPTFGSSSFAATGGPAPLLAGTWMFAEGQPVSERRVRAGAVTDRYGWLPQLV